jgi:hypothetical protein
LTTALAFPRLVLTALVMAPFLALAGPAQAQTAAPQSVAPPPPAAQSGSRHEEVFFNARIGGRIFRLDGR